MASTSQETSPLLPPGQEQADNNCVEPSVQERKVGGGEATRAETQEEESKMAFQMSNLSRRGQWIVLALASGGSAAFNGVFAKLTTTSLTTSLSTSIAHLFGFQHSLLIESLIRGIFFLLNLLFNFIMWTLFTRALTAGTSTTQVSILNTSANFVITALAGWAIFGEELKGLWWVGAAMLVVGNVIIGRREEEEGKGGRPARGEEPISGAGLGDVRGEAQAEGLLDGQEEGVEELEMDRTKAKGREEEEEDILDFGEEEELRR